MNNINELLDYSYMKTHMDEMTEQLLQNDNLIEKKIAILCGGTFGDIKGFLEIFLLVNGIKPIFLEGNYNRYYEEACFPNKELEDFAPDMIILHTTNRNLICQQSKRMMSDELLEDEKQRLIDIWHSLEEKYHCVIIQNTYEYMPYRIVGNAARYCDNGNIRYIDRLNDFIVRYAKEHTKFYINDVHYLSAYVGLANWYDDRMWYMYKYPMKMDVMPRYAWNIANIIKSVYGKNKKTIITDLDDTLWGGIIGDVGVENIKLGSETPQGEGYENVQKYLKSLADNGIILNVCSKNEYETGIQGINSEKSVLEENDFAIKKINWNPKVTNVDAILKELNLLEDAAVFLDDSAVECDSVSTMLPGIEVVRVQNLSKTLEQLDLLSYFEITEISKEDKVRSQYYQENLKRNQEKAHYKSYEDYLQSLAMISHVSMIDDTNIQRVTQLFNKTNQFNFTTNRYSVAELEELCKDSNVQTIVMDLQDRFGNNGIVTIAILRYENQVAHIEDWLMSCRVFERQLEYAMLEMICKNCLLKGIRTLYGYYIPTKKNSKIKTFFKQLGFSNVMSDNQKESWLCEDINTLLDIVKKHTITIKEEK